jgi:hypothetical protein
MMVGPRALKGGDGMIGRSTVLAFLALALLGGPATATENALCERLFVPEGYSLDCSVHSGPGQDDWVLTVHPDEGTFAPLSELTIRPVTEPVSDPKAWLREQLTLDMSSFDATLEELLHGADSPLADTPMVGQLESWRGLLRQAAGWPLAGCDEPESLADDDSWRMECQWEVGPFRQFMAVRLIEADGERYAVRIRAMNEQRMRHLVAIANSF